ncbi:MAG: thioredoxin domain-containing protein [Bacteroidota bacterium]
MRKYLLISFATAGLLFNSCTNGQSQISTSVLTPSAYADKIKSLPSAPIIDVRTPEEYAKGHLINAKNFDWNGDDFKKQIASLDKSKPAFVYCLSGKRSAAAAIEMRNNGFIQVYELNGGIMKWRAENLPETTANSTSSAGMSKLQFEGLLNSDKLVLVDFYADWCAPCKVMKPYLDEISKEMTDKVVIVRVNVDDNQSLCKELKVDELPVLQLYKNNTLTWSHSGLIEKANIEAQLK